MADLLSLPFNEISPIYHLKPFEIEFFNINATKEDYEYTLNR